MAEMGFTLGWPAGLGVPPPRQVTQEPSPRSGEGEPWRIPQVWETRWGQACFLWRRVPVPWNLSVHPKVE